MKQLVAGVVLILVLGIAAFLYRNEVERPLVNVAPLAPQGASGATSLAIGSTTLNFVLPAGYTEATSTGNQPNLVASYTQSGDSPSIINVYNYPFGAGKNPDQVILSETRFDPSGMQATSTSAFTQVTEGENTFSEIQIGRFEGQVQTAYYLPLATSVLRFDIVERGVTNWTDPGLDTSTLPQHQALAQMLATLQIP